MKRSLFASLAALGVLLASALVLALSGSPAAQAQGSPIPNFVGSDTCGDCHVDQAAQHELHGHNYILNRVSDGQPPRYPFGEAPEPPEGYTWDDISMVIGGFRWWARFIDLQGYVITGEAVQYNAPIVDWRTGEVVVEATWSAYSPGDQRPYTCGSCHTTGFNHNPRTNMDGLPGLLGEWSEEGVQCEECHGPGSLHVEDPIRANMLVNTSSEACARCHSRGSAGLRAEDGFVDYHAQYNELQGEPHAALECIDCHDPHQSAVYAEEEVNPTRSLRVQCADCHFRVEMQPQHAASGVACTDCHMPPMTVGGSSNPDRLWADERTHLFQINTDPDAPQFSEDGSRVMPYITVQYACTRCHSDWSAEEMAENAQGYHGPEG